MKSKDPVFQPLSRWKKILIHDDKNNILHEFYLNEKEKLVEPIKNKKLRRKDKMQISAANFYRNRYPNCDNSTPEYVGAKNMILPPIPTIFENPAPKKSFFELHNEIIFSYEGSNKKEHQEESENKSKKIFLRSHKQQVTVKRSRFIISLNTNDENSENILLLNKD